MLKRWLDKARGSGSGSDDSKQKPQTDGTEKKTEDVDENRIELNERATASDNGALFGLEGASAAVCEAMLARVQFREVCALCSIPCVEPMFCVRCRRFCWLIITCLSPKPKASALHCPWLRVVSRCCLLFDRLFHLRTLRLRTLLLFLALLLHL